jgi:hypothetical protein
MPGRETDYERGFIRGVSAMMYLISSDKVKRLDKANVLQYARQVIEEEKESHNGVSVVGDRV